MTAREKFVKGETVFSNDRTPLPKHLRGSTVAAKVIGFGRRGYRDYLVRLQLPGKRVPYVWHTYHMDFWDVVRPQ
jgi:hypothetical protein